MFGLVYFSILNKVTVIIFFEKVSEAVKYLHEKDGNSRRVTHNSINPTNIYLTKDMHVRLGNFGRSTKALRTESRSESTGKSTDVIPRFLRYTDYFISKRRHNNKQGLPKKTDDVFSLGASVYATLANEDPTSKKFYIICENEFKMKLPVWKKIVEIEKTLSDENHHCNVVYELLKIVEICCLENDDENKKNIENVLEKFEFLSEMIGDLESAADEAAEKLKLDVKEKYWKPDDTWEPVSTLLSF